MDQKPHKPIISTGTTSFVLIFVLLCLLTFSVLSLASSRANLRLSQKSADRTAAYYDAENRANDILIRIDTAIGQILENNISSSQEFYDMIRKELEGTDGILFSGQDSLEYQVPLEKEQLLHVVLRLSFEPFSNGKHYQILSWDTQSDYDWSLDQEVQLME